MTTATDVARIEAPPAPLAVSRTRERSQAETRPAAAFANPYLAGIGLGLVLLAAFVVMGRGLGASGAFSAFVAWTVDGVAPAHAEGNGFYQSYLAYGNPLKGWLVFEVLGMVVGGLVSGLLAGRVRPVIEKGPRIGTAGRLGLAFLGGLFMAAGAKLARGCTSGQALTGGALLNAGSWAFMLAVFAGAYGVAWFVRRQWR